MQTQRRTIDDIHQENPRESENNIGEFVRALTSTRRRQTLVPTRPEAHIRPNKGRGSDSEPLHSLRTNHPTRPLRWKLDKLLCRYLNGVNTWIVLSKCLAGGYKKPHHHCNGPRTAGVVHVYRPSPISAVWVCSVKRSRVIVAFGDAYRLRFDLRCDLLLLNGFAFRTSDRLGYEMGCPDTDLVK